MEHSPQWEVFTPDHQWYPSWQVTIPSYAIQSEDVPRHLSDADGLGNRPSPQHIGNTHWYMHLQPYPWGAWPTPPPADEDSQRTLHNLQQLKVSDQANPNHLLWCSIHCTRHVARSLQDPGPSHTQFLRKTSVLPRTDKWPSTPYSTPLWWNYIFVRTAHQVRLEPLDWCSL